MKHILCMAAAILLSPPAFAWEMTPTFDLLFASTIRASTTFYSAATESGVDRGDSQASVLPPHGAEPITKAKNCTRSSSSADLYCSASAFELNPSVSCEYCGKGGALAWDLRGQIWVALDSKSWDEDDKPCFTYLGI